MKRAALAPSLLVSSLLSASGCIPIDHGEEPFGALPRGPAPSFGQTVSLDRPPPPMSGGTLLVTSDGKTAVAADPDRDRVVFVDLELRRVRATVGLARGDEPGRSAEDAMGVVHVVLRGAGEIADIDANGALLRRRSVCPAPRGIAFDKAHNELIVACAGGELVRLPPSGGVATRTSDLGRDLRDVVIDSDGVVLVTRMRTAEILILDGADQVVNWVAPPAGPFVGGSATPNTAWRATAIPGGGILVAHQRATNQVVETTPGGYGGAGDANCGPTGASIVHSTATVIRRGGFGVERVVPTPMFADVVLPVDIAVFGAQQEVAVLSAGNAYVPGASQVMITHVPLLETAHAVCVFTERTSAHIEGEAIALAYGKFGELYVQTREPATLQFDNGGDPPLVTIPLGGESRFDTGFAVFHANSSAGLACASCHAEGGDDARTWQFAGLGPRRTQSLRGGITNRAPYHWSGDEANFSHLVSDVFVGRMSGPELDGPQTAALSHFVDRIPALPASAVTDANAVVRGRALFNQADGCASCHSGSLFTDNRVVSVGTGGSFKTPSLVDIGFRAPYRHDGCAPTLKDRFSAQCGGDLAHGARLSPAQVDDLVAYLETL